ncbi:MAG TPA: c-type cytochrome [Casimicrobiaceae bacterium]
MRLAAVCALLTFAAISVAASGEALPPGTQLAASCAMCHGTQGRSAGGNEPLAGMAKEELVRKFAEFRSGAKPATVMHQIAKGYTDAELNLVADYFAAQKR